ncbi:MULTISPECIES: c-type cytochrome [Sulfurimonas]|uniref:c-type cytochrome n=1 Tax=Sulfurimonas TaxID=202746 RepID=UPI001E2A4346|nr:cytochrome C [Sulfurimonas hydrogeniphila]
MKSLFILLCFLGTLLQASQNSALLFHGNCTTCHFETKSVSAPAMMEVRTRYLNAFPNKKDFVRQMAEWVQKPSETTSIMQDAIDKYELMPNLAFEKDVLQDIAAYIYETDFTRQHSPH